MTELFAQTTNTVASNVVIAVTIIFMLTFIALAIASLVGWIIMLVHAITNEIDDKVLWIVLLLLVNISWIVYYFIVKRPYDLKLKNITSTP